MRRQPPGSEGDIERCADVGERVDQGPVEVEDDPVEGTLARGGRYFFFLFAGSAEACGFPEVPSERVIT